MLNLNRIRKQIAFFGAIVALVVGLPLLAFWRVSPATSAEIKQGASSDIPPVPPRIGMIRYRRPLNNNPVTLDPARPNDIYGRTVANQLFDGLVQFDGALAIRPAIASSWTASRDGLVWTFNLRTGVKFHNGREVTADDFVYSFTRIVSPQTQSAGAPLFLRVKGAREFAAGRVSSIEGLEALDRYTLRITLVESQTPFVSSLAVGFAKVVPREVVSALGDNFGKQPVGTGPFRFLQWKGNKEIILERNAEYFEGPPSVERLEYRVFPADAVEEMFEEFKRGNLEDAPFPAGQRAALLSDKSYQFIRRPILGLAFFGISTAEKPLDDPRVRQAMTLAIDRVRIVKEVYEDRSLPGAGILPPGTYGYDPTLAGYPHDPKKAALLLAAAGYPDGKGLPVIHIWSARKNEETVTEHEAIARSLAAIGVKTEFHYNTNWPEYKAQVYAGKLPIFRYSWYADTPDPETFLGQLFDSRSPDNTTRYRNPTVDTLLQRARLEPDAQKKLQLYQEAERRIVADAPILPLSYYTYERVFQPYVKGIQVSALGDPYIPMKKIWIEPLKAK